MSWHLEQLYAAQFELMIQRWREENWISRSVKAGVPLLGEPLFR